MRRNYVVEHRVLRKSILFQGRKVTVTVMLDPRSKHNNRETDHRSQGRRIRDQIGVCELVCC